ncbi:MAG: cytochrome P450 [Marmoricola sp.]
MTATLPLPEVLPGDRGLPFLGRTLDYAKDPLALMRHQWETYGPVAPMRSMGRTAVMLLGPDACGTALVNGDRAYANGPAWGEIVGPFFHGGLMLRDFDDHHVHRRIMQEAFTAPRLDGYLARVHPAVAAGTAGWDGPMRVHPALKQLTLGIAAEIFMGGVADASPARMQEVNRAFIACVQAAAGIVRADVPLTRWGRAYRGRRLLEDFLRQYLPAKRASATDDFFSVLCHIETEDGQRFSDDDVVNHMVFLMMAAHDTSTITASTMMQFLGQHPDWQERCREESAALGPEPTRAELEALPSLDLVMKESLRLRAPVPVLMRRTVKETVVQGRTIPADTSVIVAVQWSHLMPEYWSEPTRFDPERFSAQRREDRNHRHAWTPFGGGVHKCIGLHFGGLEVKAILHRMLRHHRWSVDPGYVAPIDNHSLPFPKDGLPIALRALR